MVLTITIEARHRPNISYPLESGLLLLEVENAYPYRADLSSDSHRLSGTGKLVSRAIFHVWSPGSAMRVPYLPQSADRQHHSGRSAGDLLPRGILGASVLLGVGYLVLRLSLLHGSWWPCKKRQVCRIS